MVDFSSGLIFGLRGSIEKITNKVFLLSPAYIEVSKLEDEGYELVLWVIYILRKILYLYILILITSSA